MRLTECVRGVTRRRWLKWCAVDASFLVLVLILLQNNERTQTKNVPLRGSVKGWGIDFWPLNSKQPSELSAVRTCLTHSFRPRSRRVEGTSSLRLLQQQHSLSTECVSVPPLLFLLWMRRRSGWRRLDLCHDAKELAGKTSEQSTHLLFLYSLSRNFNSVLKAAQAKGNSPNITSMKIIVEGDRWWFFTSLCSKYCCNVEYLCQMTRNCQQTRFTCLHVSPQSYLARLKRLGSPTSAH